MLNEEDIKNIERLIIDNSLGKKINNITRISGGSLHTMYKVETDMGSYAVRRLNPEIMERENSYSNFVFSEKVASIANDNGVSAVKAIKLNNDIITKIDNCFYMVFNWINGKTITARETNNEHCKKIALQVAKIHNIDFSKLKDIKRNKNDFNYIDFEYYISLAKKENNDWIELLIQNKDLLIDIENNIKDILKEDDNFLVISHTDIHRKNSIWNNNIPYIIDWEASGYIDPFLEIYQVAWYWCKEDNNIINYNKFKLMLETYKQNVHRKVFFNINKLIYKDMYGRINWLDYNLKRVLELSNMFDNDIIELSIKEIIDSINEIKFIFKELDNINNIFNEVNRID